MDLTGFVLAGGQSSRMGTDKALLDWHGRTLLDHMIHVIRAAAHPVHVVGRGALPDRRPGMGPLAGIATGLEASLTDANLFVAVDIPFLTEDFMVYLRNRMQKCTQPLLACKIGSSYPLCLGVWRPMLPEIQRFLDARQLSVRALIQSGYSLIVTEEELVAAGFSSSMFRNINTEQDYRDSLM